MRVRYRGTAVLFLWMGLLLQGLPAAGQTTGTLPPIFDGVGIDEQRSERVPADLAFLDETGAPVTIGSYLNTGKPVVLNFVYHSCPMLCNLVLDGLTKTLKELAWVPGDEFEVLTVSFSPTETPELAARQKVRYVRATGKAEAEAGWHFLTGSQASIEALTAAVGYRFKWVEDAQEYAHPSALIFLSSEGVVTRYLHGMDFPARNVRNALVEASEGTVGTTVDQLILYCFQYDPTANSYVPHAVNLMKLGGLLTILVLGLALTVLWRREKNKLRLSEMNATG